MPGHNADMTITILTSPKARPRLSALPLCLLFGVACDTAPNVSTDSYAACAIASDGSDGSAPDGIADHSKLRYFDDQGLLERVELDTNGDGGMDEVEFFHYDGQSQMIRAERYHITSDALVGETEQVFDGEGRIVLQTVDNDADGFIESSDLTFYGEEGHRLVRTRYQAGGIGIQSLEETRYGLFGIEESVLRWPDDEGQPTQRTRYTYESWRLVKVESFEDTELLSVTENRYSATGLLTSSLFTRNGTASLTTYSHDDRGFINGWVLDDNVDGIIDSSAVCAADDEGRMISEEMDLDNDGVIDYRFELTFDEEGRMVSDLQDEDGDKSDAHSIVTYRYDCG